MKIGIYQLKDNHQITSILENKIYENGHVIDNEHPDLVFFIGGDGTFLRVVQKYIDELDHILFVGLKTGSLGFFYDFNEKDLDSLFIKLANKEYVVKEFPLLRGHAIYENDEKEFYAVNEIRLENPFRTLISNVSINDELLEVFRGNGLIVSSCLGSSAYNKSLGGALIDHDLASLQLTEIASIQNNSYRSINSPLVLAKDKTITFTGDFEEAFVGYDYLSINQDNLLSLNISLSDKKVRLLYHRDHSFIRTLRKSFVA